MTKQKEESEPCELFSVIVQTRLATPLNESSGSLYKQPNLVGSMILWALLWFFSSWSSQFCNSFSGPAPFLPRHPLADFGSLPPR